MFEEANSAVAAAFCATRAAPVAHAHPNTCARRQYPFLCKPKDDLRKDARMMELMTAVNRMLFKSSSCRRRRLAVRCYSVVPLDQECGLIEWVPHMLQAR